ncbi:hypothetical protein SAMN04488121_101689 [Chitinophaga filiformis]|uniref:Uncharacterized protein n=1 Tax=Chitinophaga filiformis TaxID=104663 RepID=A0A1G7I1S3_CHIFI|nr:hypothetical protein SAMN04488121_101689 [Chitinophaga filiformis]
MLFIVSVVSDEPVNKLQHLMARYTAGIVMTLENA